MVFNYDSSLLLSLSGTNTSLTISVSAGTVYFRWNSHGKYIDWGDGTTSIASPPTGENNWLPQSHTYSSSGTYTITIPNGTDFVKELSFSSSGFLVRVIYAQPFCTSTAASAGVGTTLWRPFFPGNGTSETVIPTVDTSTLTIGSYAVPSNITRNNFYIYRESPGPIICKYPLGNVVLKSNVKIIREDSFRASDITRDSRAREKIGSFTFEGDVPSCIGDPFKYLLGTNTKFYVPNQYLTNYQNTAPFSNYSSRIIGV